MTSLQIRQLRWPAGRRHLSHGRYGERGGFDVAPHFLVSHQAEPDLEVRIAELESVGHPPKFLGVGVVGFLDPPVVGAAGDPERVVDLLGLDFAVEQVVKQGLELPAVLVCTWHTFTIAAVSPWWEYHPLIGSECCHCDISRGDGKCLPFMGHPG